MLKVHDTKGYSDADGRVLGKERFSPTKTFSPSPISVFVSSLPSIHPWEISEQIKNYLCLLSVTNFG